MDKKRAESILEKTKKDYEAIAQAFSDSRTDLWEEREYFGQYVKDSVSVLDLGCANGRLLKLFEKHKVWYTGADNSRTMLKNAESYSKSFSNISVTFVDANIINLPFEDNSFDQVFCIASLHHVPSAGYQHKALSEMYRVLKPGGMLLMSNWNIAPQGRYVRKREHLKQERPELFEGFGDQDYIITWKWHLSDKTIYRYYYSFSEEELSKLVQKTGFSLIKQVISNGGLNLQSQRIKRNIITIAYKPA